MGENCSPTPHENSTSFTRSQTSPMPSPSVSAWSGLATSGQLSSGRPIRLVSLIPSPSVSSSQASPMPSPSRSDWEGLTTSAQLSQGVLPSALWDNCADVVNPSQSDLDGDGI